MIIHKLRNISKNHARLVARCGVHVDYDDPVIVDNQKGEGILSGPPGWKPRPLDKVCPDCDSRGLVLW